MSGLSLRQQLELMETRRPAFCAEPFDEWLGQEDGGILFGKARLLCHAPEVARRRALAKENRNKRGSWFLAPSPLLVGEGGSARSAET
ncbi:hypothetical protein, partial [Mesorhizobium sp.]|uniref:hypothetical protein n=1 Tax=Mesorhizobium sp. TaxID=1871066 RepID=UPI0025C5FE4E